MKDSSHYDKTKPGLIQTLSSLQFGLVVLIAIAVVAVVGTIIPQDRSLDFYRDHYGTIIYTLIIIFRFDSTYSSPLFISLLGLFGINLTLCSLIKFPTVMRRTFRPNLTPDSQTIEHKSITISAAAVSLEKTGNVFKKAGFPLKHIDDTHLYGDKGRLGYLGSFIVHMSLLVFLCGGIISLITGVRGHITLTEGESTSEALISGDSPYPLGFEITLNSFDVEFYKDFPGRPKSFTSSVTVTLTDSTTIIKKDIQVNDPLMLHNFTVYQSSYGIVDEPQYSQSLDDTAHVAVRLKGIPDTEPPIITFDMVIGEKFTFPGFGDSITVQLAELSRNFMTGTQSRGAAVRIDVIVNGKKKWGIYSFKNFPGLNMPMYEDIPFTFSMLDIKMVKSEPERIEYVNYYTVLGIVRDRGVPFMWTGAVLLMLGLFFSFFIRPRRIWILKKNGLLLVGADAKGDPKPFKYFIEQTLIRLQTGE